MFDVYIRHWIIGFLTAMMISPAQAALTTWNFTGIVQADQPDAGMTVSGYLSFDPSEIQVFDTDGLTTAYGRAVYNPPIDTTSFAFSGALTYGTTSMVIGNDDGPKDAMIAVIKSPLLGDEYLLWGASTFGSIDIMTFMGRYGTPPSGIFSSTTNPNPDLSFDQQVNWFSPGATSVGDFYDSATGIQRRFTLLSVTATQVEIPEPSTVLLILISLAGVTVINQRRIRALARLPLAC